MFVKKIFLSRYTVIVLIALSTAAITLSALVPQSFLTPVSDMGRWKGEHPVVSRIADALGLHHLYTHPVFALILAGVVISLVFSAVDQVWTAVRRTREPRGASAAGEVIKLPAGRAAYAPVLRSWGYFPMGRGKDAWVFMKHPWGHWGNALLHIGIAVAIASSFLIAITQQRGLVHLIEKELHEPSMPWFAEENGIAAGSLTLPFSVKLERLTYSFRTNYGVKEISSRLTFLTEGQEPATATVAINAILHRDGIRIYQGSDFGHAFYVEVRDESVERRIIPFLMPHPRTPSEAGYNEFRDMMPPGDLLRAKYYVDEQKQSFMQVNPLLVLRIDRLGTELGQVPLRIGDSGSIGPYQFRLMKVSPWARLIFVNITGIPGVFTGFIIIVLGGILHYFTPPREALLFERENGGSRLVWRAAKFAAFYRDEYESLSKALSEGARHG